jgi:hypothetical protein
MCSLGGCSVSRLSDFFRGRVAIVTVFVTGASFVWAGIYFARAPTKISSPTNASISSTKNVEASALGSSSKAAVDDEDSATWRKAYEKELMQREAAEREMSRRRAQEAAEMETSRKQALEADVARLRERQARLEASTAQKKQGPVDDRELENFFPWPPPPASARTTLPSSVFADRKRFAVIGDAAGFLEQRLREAGFDGQWSYFKLPDERAAFGLISQVEQIDPESGKALAGASRWTSRVVQADQTSWWGSLFSVYRPVGHYRVFVFIVSTKPTPDKSPKDLKEEEKANLAMARYWASGGKGSLTKDIAMLAMGSSHRLTVRVYEFDQEDKGKSRLVQPAALSPMQHLAGAGIKLESNQ